MKIGITGHSAGIGRDLYSYFSKNHEVFGYSRSNGYELPNCIDSIVDQAKVNNFDIFINNAYNRNFDDSQEKLLKKFIVLWQENKNKIIINMSSQSPDHGWHNKYAAMKGKLDQKALTFSLNYDIRCRILNLKPGYVNVESQKNHDYPKLDTKYIIDTIEFCINLPKDVNIYSLSIQKK